MNEMALLGIALLAGLAVGLGVWSLRARVSVKFARDCEWMAEAALRSGKRSPAPRTIGTLARTGSSTSLPSHDPKYPDDQLTLVCIPPNWNGNLVMYAHGYVPAQAQLALPPNP